LVGAALVVNAGMLFAADRLASRGTKSAAGLADSIVVGLFQVIAIIPGISRSGWTISGGMFRGLERETAATFAFLLSVPILAGAFLFCFLTLDSYNLEAGPALLGFAAAMMSGLASIGLLLKAVRAGKFWVFGVYCAIVGCAVLVLTVL
jgi:undecaprenyl-diphosphatase